MSITNQIIIVSILFSICLVVISVGLDFKEKNRDAKGFVKFLILERIFLIALVSYILIYLFENNKIVQSILVCVTWFVYCSILAMFLSILAYIFNYYSKLTSTIIVSTCYYAIFIVMIELYVSRFEITYNSTGYNFNPGVIPQGIFYGVPIALFVSCSIILLRKYYIYNTKPRDRYIFRFALWAVIPCIVGLVIESILHEAFSLYYPIFIMSLLVPYIVLKNLIICNRDLSLHRDDFEEYLKASRTDAVFICDDEQVIQYENKAAEIMACMNRDNFIGRKLSDVFIIELDIERAINIKEKRDGLMVPAIYPQDDRSIVMSVEHQYDVCGEILCSIVTIPNYEVSISKDNYDFFLNSNVSASPVDEDEDSLNGRDEMREAFDNVTDKAVIAADSHVLIVDDKPANLNVYEKLFNPYDVRVTRAIGGRAALDLLQNPWYDIIFIAYDMEKFDGVETAKRIREMGDEYYSDVPIVFVLSTGIDEVYKDLLGVNFNDFIQVPISARKLNTILTRWLWRRYSISERYEFPASNTKILRYNEALEELYNDCVSAFNNEEWVLLGYNLKGIKRVCSLVEDDKLINVSDKLMAAYLLDEYEDLGSCFEEFYFEKERVRSKMARGVLF